MSIDINNQLISNELLKELLSKQLKNVPKDKKLQYIDLKKICKHINSSMFDKNNCCIWSGYVTNTNNSNKGVYINFYFKKKKVALHRLIYINFIGQLSDEEYLRFTCVNKGKCCNVYHLKKFKYHKKIKMNHSLDENNKVNQNISQQFKITFD